MNEKNEALEVTQKDEDVVNPFKLMRRLSRDMERMFENMGESRFPFFNQRTWPFQAITGGVDWRPQLEVIQVDGKVVVRADLPGVSTDDIKVEFSEDMLKISGERKDEKEESAEGFYRSERSYGKFYRRMPLPQGANPEEAEATFHNGVLEITIPAPRAEVKARQIEVKDAVKKQDLAEAPVKKAEVKAAA